LLIGADFLVEHGLVVNFKINCLMYEIELNLKQCKFTNKVEAELQSPENIGHGFQETTDHKFTQTINGELVWTMSKNVECVNRNRELYDEMIEEEMNCLDISVEKNGKGNTPCVRKVLTL
jgi:hypothetical protein